MTMQPLLHIFKEILDIEEDSNLIKALTQEVYIDIAGFLSIQDASFAHYIVKELLNNQL